MDRNVLDAEALMSPTMEAEDVFDPFSNSQAKPQPLMPTQDQARMPVPQNAYDEYSYPRAGGFGQQSSSAFAGPAEFGAYAPSSANTVSPQNSKRSAQDQVYFGNLAQTRNLG